MKKLQDLLDEYPIIIGSKSPHKRLAVDIAINEMCGDYDRRLLGVDVESVAPAQPYGYEAIWNGAKHRANVAARKSGVGVGIENGIVSIWGKPDLYNFYDVAVVWIVAKEHAGSAISAGVQIPVKYVQASRDTHWQVPAGAFIAEDHPDCDPADWVSFLTQGATSRSKLIAPAVVAAFAVMLGGGDRGN